MTRVLVAAWAGSTNLGDELILAALVRQLGERGCQVAVVSVDPARTRADHGVGALAHTDPAGLWGALGDCDAAVLGGGGLIQDETSPFNLPYHLSRVWLAALRSVPWAGVGLGVGPLETWLGRGLARTLSGAVAVSVRDAASLRLLRDVGVGGVRLGADLALSLPQPEVTVEDVTVACLRPWSGELSWMPVGMRKSLGTPNWFLDGMAGALDDIHHRTGRPTRFVAMQTDRDDEIHRQVAERMDSPTELRTPGLDEVVGEVASGRVVVSMRFHGGVAAVLGGRPSVLVDYSPKVRTLAADLGAGARALEFSPEGLASVADAAEEVAPHEDEVLAARRWLREREAVNGEVLDQLLGAADRR